MFLLWNMDESFGLFLLPAVELNFGQFNDEFFPTSHGLFLLSVCA
jgi:hypothetical protein